MVNIEEPLTYVEAMIGREKNKWRSAIQKEMNSINLNHIWGEAGVPTGKRLIPCKIKVLKILNGSRRITK